MIMTSHSIATAASYHADSSANDLLVESTRLHAPLSSWSRSRSKRILDAVCVISALPVVMPVLLLAAVAVRLTSEGPVLFRQERSGRHGQPFTIYKFRTMPVGNSSIERPSITTSTNQRFTPVGPFLRRWKLDELPQIFNVLRGDMSLVGPRPKLPEHQFTDLACRPGITGNATCFFAREEILFAGVPAEELAALNNDFVLPFKERLDYEYMSTASCSSDLRLILKSVFRKWDHGELHELMSLSAERTR
jgi:lipopolysaccharide/colanic/teichoic acid biosynthesis glycosyltransferase